MLPGFNEMIASGKLTLGGDGLPGSEAPCEPAAAADMQGVKALMGMTASSHSVWCEGDADHQHKYCTVPVKSYAEVLAYLRKIGCVMKTSRGMCEDGHY